MIIAFETFEIETELCKMTNILKILQTNYKKIKTCYKTKNFKYILDQ